MKMTEMPSYLAQSPSFEPYKPPKSYPKKGTSLLLSIIFSIFTYILIFYVFKVSPSSILNDTKILFFIANTLIIIIAADYGAFTDKEDDDLYRKYTTMKRSHVYVPVYQENPRWINEHYVMGTKDIACLSSHEETPEKVLREVSENVHRNESSNKNDKSDNKNVHGEKSCDARNTVSPKPHRGSVSDKARDNHKRNDVREKGYDRSEPESSKWMIVHNEKSEKKKKTAMDQKLENVEEGSDEFSKMSNEELNRRVEEFIQRFNRQMRLQSLKNRQILS